LDSKADLLVYGNGERQICEIAHRLAAGESVSDLTDIRGTAFVRKATPEGWIEIDSTHLDAPGPLNPPVDPYAMDPTTGSGAGGGAGTGAGGRPGTDAPRVELPPLAGAASADAGAGSRYGTDAPRVESSSLVGAVTADAGTAAETSERVSASHGATSAAAAPPAAGAPVAPPVEVVRATPPCASASASARVEKVVRFVRRVKNVDRERSVIRMPSHDQVATDPVLYAHASRILHLEANPGNARALVQRHGDLDVWLNPPPIPLTTREMDWVYDKPYARQPHPSYGDANIPAYKMIRFSIAIQRGCFGGCTFCSITEHEGRIIQSRSESSVIREIEDIRDNVPGFTGVISDLGGPTANMYRLACKSREVEAACRRPSCVYPGICPNLNTDHTPLIKLYRRARALPGIK
jgi:radical SAM superfamily enzyme YgiQ (UPF0313 family)